MKLATKNIKVKIKTSDGQLLRGKINLNSESEKVDRLSDFFVKGTNPFLTLYGVAAQGGDTVIIVNKKHIITVTPDGDDTVEADVVITGDLSEVFDGSSSDVFDPNPPAESPEPAEIEMVELPEDIEIEAVEEAEPELTIESTPEESELELEMEDAPKKAEPKFALKEKVNKPALKPEKKSAKIEDFIAKKKDKPIVDEPEPELELDGEEFHISDLDDETATPKPVEPPKEKKEIKKPKNVVQSTKYTNTDDWDR